MKPSNPRLRPSAASRWMNCPGSTALIDLMAAQNLLVEKESQAATHGTNAHTYAECRIKSLYGPPSEREEWTAKAVKAREKLPPEIATNADTYVSWVSSYLFGQTEG